MSNNVIDIGNKMDHQVYRVFGYYEPTPKTTIDGHAFKTYFGLRQFYITRGFDTKLLSLTDQKEIQTLSRRYKWSHRWDLSMLLMQALIHNIRLNPHVMEGIPVTADITWCKPDGLNRNEKAWLDIVKSVNANR